MVVKALEERSNFVMSRVVRGNVMSVRLLNPIERVVSEGNMAVKSRI